MMTLDCPLRNHFILLWSYVFCTHKSIYPKRMLKGIYSPMNNLILQTRVSLQFPTQERGRNGTEGDSMTHWGTKLESSSLLCARSFTLAVPLSFQLASITSRFSFNKQPSTENSIFHSSKCITRKSEMQGNKERLIIRILPLAVVKPHGLAHFQG